MHRSPGRGFTLIECLLVIFIIGVIGYLIWDFFIQPSQTNKNQNVLLLDLSSQGSKSADPWTFSLYTNGGGVLTFQKSGNRTAGSNKSYKLGTFNSVSITYYLDQINFTRPPTCSSNSTNNLNIDTGSVSFQQVVSLIYNGKKLNSFCSTNQAEFNLYKQLKGIESTTNP